MGLSTIICHHIILEYPLLWQLESSEQLFTVLVLCQENLLFICENEDQSSELNLLDMQSTPAEVLKAATSSTVILYLWNYNGLSSFAFYHLSLAFKERIFS